MRHKIIKNIFRLEPSQKFPIKERKAYSHDLLNCLFYSPYTKIEHFEQKLNISRPTAARYLDTMVQAGILTKAKVWRQNYYINKELVDLLAKNQSSEDIAQQILNVEQKK